MKGIQVAAPLTDEWYAARATGIGASEIGAVLGLNPWVSPLEIWARKTDKLDPREESEKMRWGQLLERSIVQETALRAGVTVSREPAWMLRSEDHEWMLATPDAVLDDGSVVEVKNVGQFTDWDGIPPYYHAQCQQSLMVTGAPRALFGALIGGQRLVWTWVEPDLSTQMAIVLAGAKMWELIQTRVPPVPDGSESSRRVLLELSNNDYDSHELFESEVGPLLDRRMGAKARKRSAQTALKIADKELDQIEDQILLAMNGHTKAHTANGWEFSVTKSYRAGYVVKPSECTTFKIREPKAK